MRVFYFTNKRNENKKLEVHHSKCGHYTVCQFIQNGSVVNYTGVRHNRKKLRRWKKADLMSLLEDYESNLALECNCSICGKNGVYVLDNKEEESFTEYIVGNMYLDEALPKVPNWIRAGAADMRSNGFCICPKHNPV